MAAIPQDLVDQLAAGAGSVFVGAGVSIASGLPSWTSLLDPLRKAIIECPENASFLDVAQFYENHFGRFRLTEEVRRRLETSGKKATPLHNALVNLVPKGRIYTTNLDTLLEDAAQASGLDFRKTVNTDPPVSFDRDRLNIVKLHGDLGQINSYVLTAQDYESYFRKNPGLTRLIGAEFQTGTVLFVGYSHSDIDLRMILRRITDENGRFSRSHYTLQVNPCQPIVEDLERRGLRVISFQCNGDSLSCNETLARWIDAVSARVQSATGAPQPQDGGLVASSKHNFPIPIHGKLIGREKDLTAVFAALATSHIAIVSIEGFSGVGKTALAYEVGLACLSGHNGAPRFDHAVWLSANKPDQKLWFREFLNTIAITVTGEPLPDGGEVNARDKYRLLGRRRVLIIINDYEQIDDRELEDWISNVPEASRVLVTTKRALPRETERCCRIKLQGLEKADAMEYVLDRARSLGFVSYLETQDIGPLAEVCGGNPQAIKLALGLVGGGTISLAGVVEQLRGIPGRGLHENLLESLFNRSWALLSEDARKLLLMTPLFIGTSVVRLEALFAVSGAEQVDFDRALGQLVGFRLIEPTYDGRFITHSMTRAFARRKLEERTELRDAGIRACVKYFLRFVEENVLRLQPAPVYWNALVSDRMGNIDPEWSCIQAAIGWASEDELIEFVLRLAHYLDSRFLNVERIEYVGLAIKALARAHRTAEEALLRIDALSWTLVEADRLYEALDEIERGLQLASDLDEGDEKRDLNALGLAWRARVLVELGKLERATEIIDEALELPCSEWIRHRVHMSAGDVAMKLRRFAEAYQHYKCCERLVGTYGGEGHDYQIAPRLGFACVGLEQLGEAEEFFESVRGINQITTGRMYAEYGLALVALKRGNLEKARELLEQVITDHSGRTESSLLLKLVKEVFRSLDPEISSVASLSGLS